MFSTGSSISARLTALASRNFRVFFGGQSVSLIGTWMQQVAVSWMVYRLTHSAWWLGAVAFASQCPSFFLAPFAGVIADRWNRRTVLLVTQSLALIQAVALAVLTSASLLNVPWLLTLGFFLGCLNATDLPTRQSFFADLVEDKEALGNAVALNSMIVHAARLIGPALAGWLIWRAGEQICFLLNALTYVASITALLAISPAFEKGIAQTGGLVERLKDGATYALRCKPIRAILLLVATVSLLGMPYVVLLPLFAAEGFQGESRTLGVLIGASGAGALLGAVYLASRRSIVGLERKLAFATGLTGISLVLLSATSIFQLSLLLLALIGFGTMILMTASATLLQWIVEDGRRGRVMSFYAMAFMGTVPFGHLLAGFVAARVGVPITLALGGLGCLVAAVAFQFQLPRWQESVRTLFSGEKATSCS